MQNVEKEPAPKFGYAVTSRGCSYIDMVSNDPEFLVQFLVAKKEEFSHSMYNVAISEVIEGKSIYDEIVCREWKDSRRKLTSSEITELYEEVKHLTKGNLPYNFWLFQKSEGDEEGAHVVALEYPLEEDFEYGDPKECALNSFVTS